MTKLSRRETGHPGLDLQDITLRGILKYPWLRGPEPTTGDPKEVGVHYRKFGAYKSEQSILERLTTGHDESRSLEAEIMDWCDDICYAIHDLEDFFQANMIPLERLTVGKTAQTLSPEVSDFLMRAGHELEKNPEYDPTVGSRAFTRLLGYFPVSPYRGTHTDREELHTMTNKLIDSYIKAVSVHTTSPYLNIQNDAKHEVMLLKQLTWQYVVGSPALTTLQRGQRKVVREVYEALMTWLPEECRDKTEFHLPAKLDAARAALLDDREALDSLPTDEAKYSRMIADYICMLTEDQLIDLHQRLCGGEMKSVLDAWVRW